jgi:DNA-directed RNA polymerase subunit RPC12/RpoP
MRKQGGTTMECAKCGNDTFNIMGSRGRCTRCGNQFPLPNEDNEKAWLVLAISCRECNSLGAKLFDRAPSEGEIQSVIDAVGGMWCIMTQVVELPSNEEVFVGKIRKD